MTRFKLLSIISAFTLLFSSGCSQTIDKIDVGKVTLATISSDLQDNHSNEDVPAETITMILKIKSKKTALTLYASAIILFMIRITYRQKIVHLTEVMISPLFMKKLKNIFLLRTLQY